jgi:indolepyruvate decarboxylase
VKLHTVLFDRLWQAGVRQIFGIPGDFALNLYEALEDDGRFQVVRFSHEPSVGFAADGCARITGGLGVCLVTYGAGGLNMVNSVACAYAEESPLIVISGGPGLAERARGVNVHHQVKTFESQLKVYQEVTAFAAILDDTDTAAELIAEAIEVATKLKRPVYLEVPRDLVFADVRVEPDEPAVTIKVDEGAVTEAVGEIVARLSAASKPVLIVGVEVHRFKLADTVLRLADRLQVPVASSFLGRGAVPGRHPLFVGTYLGVASPDDLREIVESSDCVLLIGERISDTTLGVSADRLSEKNLMLAVADDVYVGHHRYQRAPIDRVLAALVEHPALPTSNGRHVVAPSSSASVPYVAGDGPIKITDVIEVLNDFVDAHPEVPLVADTGDSLFAAVEIRTNECVAPAYYATMGFAVPAAIGLEVATGRRPLVLVGDGAFQMTGPEIAHAPGLGLRPIVIVLNNSRWEMLQAFFPDAGYNQTPRWPFAELGRLWGGAGEVVTTARELAAALDRAWRAETFSIVEVTIAPGDISPVLQRFVDAFKKRVAASARA